MNVRNGSALVRRHRAAVQAAALALFLVLLPSARAEVIPLPADIAPGTGSFDVGPATALQVPRGDHDADAAARYLGALWTRTNHLTLRIVAHTQSAVEPPRGGAIVFQRRAGFAPEGYGIDVTPRSITVSASSAAGLFYGAVSLWQLLPAGAGTGRIPAQTMRDAPAYTWRGLMLDSVRHFQSAEFIRSMIDWMAWHKLNVLHWHLTDDQGWRLQIRRYPRLTSVGAWRTEPDGARYGGFYTQEQVRAIVEFAAARHVRIVPEIDMPGHATAAIAAYPALGSAEYSAQPLRVSASWGVLDHLFNLEPGTFTFLDNVLAEAAELFPGTAIHIGGDEVVGSEWIASPRVQARVLQLGIRDPKALQEYFTARIGRALAARGRRIIGWDEILRPGIRKDAIVMSWHGVSGAHAAALAGNDAVLAPAPTLYFDNRQSTLPGEPPGRLTVVSLEDVYRFDPHAAALSKTQQRHVLGIQANLWTEHIKTESRVEWMALPRAAALAEVAWSAPERRSWPDFLRRLVPMFARYRAFDLNYADSVFSPAAAIAPAAALARAADSPEGGFTVSLSTQAQSDATLPLAIRYTLDGREPSAQSPMYVSPLMLPAAAEILAAGFVGSEQASRTTTLNVDSQAVRRRDSHRLERCSDAIGLLLQPAGGSAATLAVDIMNPCWVDHGVDLSGGPQITATVAALPFNYEIGADAAKIRVGDARSVAGELEVHVDSCDSPALAILPLAPAVGRGGITTLPAQRLPRLAGAHDLCLRFARPRLDPQWALDWVEIGE